MKKFIAIIMAFVLVLSMAACGSDNKNEPTVPDETHAHETPVETQPKPTQPKPTEPKPTEPPHEHAHKVSSTVDATCTEDGYTVYKCSCGDSYNADIVKATGHNWGDWVTVEAPTTSKAGKAERYCSICVQKDTKDIPKIVEDHTHKYTEKVTKSATCTATGTKTFTCSCGSSYTEEIAKTDHKYQSTVTKPTCTAQGYTTYTCSMCKNSYKADFKDPVAHTYKDTVTKPTCTAGGYTTHTCTVCGNSYTDTKTSATGHSWTEWKTIKEPTKTSTGTAERKCNNCGKTETKTLDKIKEDHKHSYTSEVTKAATCTKDGVKTFMCSCGDNYTETIKATGHKYQATVTAPTCTAKGYTTHTCSNCGDSYKDSETAAKGHAWDNGKVTKEPTCTVDGVKTFTCSNCKTTKTEAVAKLGHDYKSTVTAPTCDKDGYTTHTCTRCNNSYKDTPTKATGHNYKDEVTKPTCTKGGYTTHTCSKCSYKYRDAETAALGHDYKATVTKPTCSEKGYTTHTCSRCNDSYKDSETPATGCVNIATKRIEPTCTEDGAIITYCVDCGKQIKVETLPSSGSHSYTTKMNLAKAVQAEIDRGHTRLSPYVQNEDFDVMVCSGCGAIDIDTMTFRYNDTETTNIMLSYINPLREAAGVAPLKADPWLIGKARTLVNNYVSTGTYGGPGSVGIGGVYDFAVDGGKNIRQHFNKAGGSANSYFLRANYKCFAYVVGVPELRETDIYCVLLMDSGE